MLERLRPRLELLAVVAAFASLLALVPGTFGLDAPTRLDPGDLPALPSADEQPFHPSAPVGRWTNAPDRPEKGSPPVSVPGAALIATKGGASASATSRTTVASPYWVRRPGKDVGPDPIFRLMSGGAPPIAYPTSPANGAVVVTTTPTLSVGAVQDPECDTVTYRFKVTTKPDAETGQIIADASLVATTSYTIPVGALRDGGIYYWHVWTSDPTNSPGTNPGWVYAFRVDLRRGDRSIYPSDSLGAAAVNLSDGNLLVGAASHSVSSLGGSLGVSFVYNHKTPQEAGLLGVYTNDADADHVVDSGEARALLRRDSDVAFSWGTDGVVPGTTATNSIVVWEGELTAPTTGTYLFGAASSDGVKITVNGTVVLNRWYDQTAGTANYDPSYPVSLTADIPVPIRIDYYRKATSSAVMKFSVKGTGSTTLVETLVPASWLTADPGPLSRGWSMVAGGGSVYVRAEVLDGSAILYEVDGTPHTYTATGSGANVAYTPPKDEDGVLARDNLGRLTLSAGSSTMVFDESGVLTASTSSADTPSSAVYTYTTPSQAPYPRLTSITDPVSGRSITLHYGGGGDCPGSAPSGFDSTAPDGKLCSVELWDTTETRLWYDSGRLARVDNPGDTSTGREIADFGYDTGSRIDKVRSSLAADMIAATLRSGSDATTWTSIAYDGSNRVSSITAPAPTYGADRPGHSYTYTSSSETRVAIAGFTLHDGSSPAFARKVTFDGVGRQLTDTDEQNLTTTYTWDDFNDVTSTTDAAGLKSTTIYDWAQRPTDSYGPAPSSWFGSDNKPTSTYASQTPHSTSTFDEGWHGLHTSFFNNPYFQGSPVAWKLGPEATGLIYGSWTSAPDPAVTASVWSARMTGEVLFDSAGTYTITPKAGSATRVFIDDVLIVDSLTAASGTYANATADARHRVRVDYVSNVTITGSTTLGYTGSSVSWTVPAQVSTLTATAYGAQGGAGGGSSGGQGAVAGASMTVSGGQTLTIKVGGQGGSTSSTSAGGAGWPNAAGGGAGGAGGGSTSAGGTSSWTGGGGGGGGTSIYSSSTPMLIAAGGGGGGGSNQAVCIGGNGGAGGASTGVGGANGQNGTGGSACQSYGPGYGGGGGSTTGGGSGAGGGSCAQAGGAGASNAGGAGGAYGCYSYGTTGGGGGGGGGYFGGGGGGSPSNNWCAGTGGGAGGGGGGSNYLSGTSTSSAQGGRTGNGQLVLSWTQVFDQGLDLHWSPPSGSDAQIPAAKIFPRYGYTTTQTDPDARTVSTVYTNPELGLPASATVDPGTGHLNLTTTNTHETGTSSFRRPLTNALPKATASGLASAKTTRNYYATSPTVETRANPCVTGSTAVNQGGFPKTVTSPDPDDTGTATAIVREVVYDGAGRIVAARVQGDTAWGCTSYDARGRVTQTVVPANTGTIGYTSSVDYSTPGTVTVTANDSSGTSRVTASVTDLLDHVTSYTDEQGTITRYVYDQAGRSIETWRQFSGGTDTKITSTLYDAGRVYSQADYLNGGAARTMTQAYDTSGRPSTVARPNGITTTLSYDTLGHASHAETNTTGTQPNEDRTFSLAGRVATDTINGAATSYTFDMAGRLTTVATGTATHSYAYDLNSNRCATTNTSTASCPTSSPAWVYDNADRISASPYASAYTYDAHGNTTATTGTAGNASMTYTYDGADHALTIDNGTTTTTETLTLAGRVLRRVVTTNATSAVTQDTTFGYASDSDSPAYSRPTAGGTSTTYLVGFGGLIDAGGSGTWLLFSLHGDTLASTDAVGTITAVSQADEFGNPTSTAPSSYGWLGANQRPTLTTTGIIRMGVRLYDPQTARFLSVDPVEGGSCNDYDYTCADPVNGLDLNGRARNRGNPPSFNLGFTVANFKKHGSGGWDIYEAKVPDVHVAALSAWAMLTYGASAEGAEDRFGTTCQCYGRYGFGEYRLRMDSKDGTPTITFSTNLYEKVKIHFKEDDDSISYMSALQQIMWAAAVRIVSTYYSEFLPEIAMTYGLYG